MKPTKHFLYRAAVVRYADKLFYEPGDLRRSHNRCHKAITQRLCGIGKDTHRNYLYYSDAELADYELPSDLKSLLRFYVPLRKRFPADDTARLLDTLSRQVTTALEPTEGGQTPCADSVQKVLLRTLNARHADEKE